MAFRSKKPYTRPTPRADVDGMWLHDKAPTGPKSGRNFTAVASNSPAATNTKLLVSNLHYEITAKDLIAIFGQIGTLVREPLIRYDRSGRSSGTAIISFETAAEATRAKKQFDGILAKGQPMSIFYDTVPSKPARRVASAPTSLLNRVQKTPLLNRISQDDTSMKPGAGSQGIGPVRNRRARPLRVAKKPQTAEELDKELDAFMGDGDAPIAQDASEPAAIDDVEMA